MKQRNCKNDHPRKLAARSNFCSVKHANSSALPGLIDPRLPIYNMSNICSSTSAESSTVGSSPTAPTSAPSEQPINHNYAASNQAVLKIKLPCSGDTDVVSLKFKRSCSTGDVSHPDPLQYCIFDHDHDRYEQAAHSFYGICKQQCSNIREKMGSDVVCSMCGDVGIAELLFLCSKCFYRPQHIYCSRSYPVLCDEASICNWCLHEENSSTISMPKESTKEAVHSETNADTKAGEVEHAHLKYGCEKRQIKEEDINDHEAHNLNVDEASLKVDGTEDVSVNIKGHGKAFEYLLMIAAESLPQVMGEAHAEIKQDNHSNTDGTMINISTDAKMGSRQIKELDHRKLDMGTMDISNSTANMGALGNRQQYMINANADNKNGLNLRLGSVQHAVKMDIVDQMGTRMGECGAVFGGGHIPRRQRCASKAGMSASLKCRKKGLQLSPSRPNYRRYKLLADVVC